MENEAFGNALIAEICGLRYLVARLRGDSHEAASEIFKQAYARLVEASDGRPKEEILNDEGVMRHINQSLDFLKES